MIQVNSLEVKDRLPDLLAKVEKDHEKIKIYQDGKPIALLVPLETLSDPLKQHPQLMGVKIHEDPTTPLDEEDWPLDLMIPVSQVNPHYYPGFTTTPVTESSLLPQFLKI